jgi:dipeptidyl aminopeptidase/acylaminoacyl peptidase
MWRAFFAVFVTALMLVPGLLLAQDKPSAIISQDATALAVSQSNRIVYSVPHLKRVKKVLIERDDIDIADFGGHEKRIVEPDRFMPAPPPVSYIVNGLTWSPDGRRIAATMTTIPAPGTEKERGDKDDDQDDDQIARKLSLPPNGTKVVALLDDDGHEIRVAGSKERFIEQASNGAWLADDQTAVYLLGAGPYKIARVKPSDGQTKTLFEGHSFDSVVWDTPRNQAFAVGSSLSLSGKTALVQLDLMNEGVREVARLPNFLGQLTVSASGKKVGYFVDGDTIEVRDVANPAVIVRVRTGPGKFAFSGDDSRILLKRGPADKSGDLVWVGLGGDSWNPILHDLEFHNFEIAPDGQTIIVMDPGKGVLKIYPLK